MSTPIENNTAGLQEILKQVNELPEGDAPGNAVLYTEQALTPEQQSQARQNIGASPVNIYTGPNEPTDENIQIWVNPDEEPENVPSKTVQTDWEQMDETAPDFLKNKPFGDFEQVIFPLSDVQFTLSEDLGGICLVIETNVSLKNGDVVKIVWDGAMFECDVIDFGDGTAGFGNLSMFGMEDTGEPFAGLYMAGMIAIVDIAADEDIIRNFSMTLLFIQKISPYYLPAYPTTYFVSGMEDGYIYSDESCSTKVTKVEAMKALRTGVVSFLYTHYGIPIRFVPATTGTMGDGFAFVCRDSENKRIIFYTAEYTPTT